MFAFIREHRKSIPDPDENGQYTQADIDQINSRNPPLMLDPRNPGRTQFFVNALDQFDQAQGNQNNNSLNNS